MKKTISILLTLILMAFQMSAQWAPRAAFSGIAKAKSTSFTIGSKIYVMGGTDNSGVILNDFWEYDIPTNSWLQKPNFPGPERYGAASFVINGKGYIATGGNNFGYLDDLWEYNPLTSQWIQKSGLPAFSAQHENQRTEAFAFEVNNKGYLGGGVGFVFGPNSTSNIAFVDLWEYNPILNSWIQKSDLPDLGKNMGIAVAINGKGYVGLGCNVDQTINHRSLWEYNATTDIWTAKAIFPTNFTTDAGAFTLNNNLYVVGGVNLNPVSLSSQFYKYDLTSNTWTSLTAFTGGAIAGEFAISNGTTAFVGTGYNGSIITRSDVWEWTIPTGLNDPSDPSMTKINIVPNPASDHINIQSSKQVSGVEIYSVNGALVTKFESDPSNINIAELPSGMYLLRIKFIDDQYQMERFIKTK
ncbi:hypothetical protein BH11BAC2_BH11BAC2_02480 [soil metagenome]